MSWAKASKPREHLWSMMRLVEERGSLGEPTTMCSPVCLLCSADLNKSLRLKRKFLVYSSTLAKVAQSWVS